MMLAGIPVRDDDVLELARLLHEAEFDDTAEALVVALEAGQARTDALTELRVVLLAEHAGREQQGLA